MALGNIAESPEVCFDMCGCFLERVTFFAFYFKKFDLKRQLFG